MGKVKRRKPLAWTGMASAFVYNGKLLMGDADIPNLYSVYRTSKDYIPVRVRITEIVKKRGGR
jgi:hypothetical protein